MFDSLSERLGSILDRLTRRGALTEADVDAALREVRRALLEADVALDVVRAFTEKVKAHAVGVEVIKSVTPGQMVVKIVHDQLIETLGTRGEPVDLNAPTPVPIMMVGLARPLRCGASGYRRPHDLGRGHDGGGRRSQKRDNAPRSAVRGRRAHRA